MRKARHLKWEMSLAFAAVSTLTLVLGLGGLSLWPELFGSLQTGLLYLAGVMLCGAGIGYAFALKYQRKLDILQLGILQVGKGNLGGRIHVGGNGAFVSLYEDFNEMCESLEHKIQLLQKLGEENVLLQSESNQRAVLEERKRLARDLHDTVSQALFALHMSASSLPKITARDPKKAEPVMEQLIEMSGHAQKQMRGLIAQLRPLELEGKSLEEALDKWFPDYCRQNGLQGQLEVKAGISLTEAKENQLFLIIQEAMANVVKHAGASRVTLSLQDYDRQTVLTVQDDGAGFDPAGGELKSYGLSTMRERAEKLGGDAQILSRPGAGTRIKVHIPKFEERNKEE